MAFSPDTYASKSVLASGNWVKVSVESTGIHFIPLADLRDMGFHDLAKVGVYGYGGRRLPDVLDAKSFIDDLPRVQSVMTSAGIYFYAVGPYERDEDLNGLVIMKANPYSRAGYYFLSDCDALPLRDIPESGIPEASDPAHSFVKCVHHESDLVSPGKTGHYFVGEDMRFTSARSFLFSLPGVSDGGKVRAGASLCTDLVGASSWDLSVSGHTATVAVDPTPRGEEYHGVVSEGWTPDFEYDGTGKLDVTLTLAGGAGNARGAWIDWVTVNYDRDISLYNSSAILFETEASEVAITGASGETIIWDVTDPLGIYRIKAGLSGDTALFSSTVTGRRVYAAFSTGNASGIPVPKYVCRVSNQNLHSLADVDMVIFTTRRFLSAAIQLAQHRRDFSQLNVEVVVQDDVFNEFASGCRDVGAFRKMLKMLYDRAEGSGGVRPGYVLMIGRGSYDSCGLTSHIASLGYELMPIWQTDNGLNDNTSFTSDDPIGMLADRSGRDFSSDELSVAIGRLPVTSAEEAQLVVSKIIEYETSAPVDAWRQRAIVIADDDDDCVHMRQAEDHCEKMSLSASGERMLVDKIYLDAYPLKGGEVVDAREELFRALDDGTVWLSYLGHASSTALSGEGIMKYSDIGGLYLRRLPFIFAATCNFMRWDADAVSGAEMLAATKGGGVIGAISATRPVYITQNGIISSLIGEELLDLDAGGLPRRIGEVLRRAKNRLSGDSNKLRFALLGDPAMRLVFAESSVVIDSVNGLALDRNEPPVIEARSEVIVSGYVKDASGAVDQTFCGKVSSTLYDADESVVSEGRGGSRFTFDRHGLRLFAGTDSVHGGRFDVKIAMPADISGNFREATLTLFAEATDGRCAAGKLRNFYVYGTDDSVERDTVAPCIDQIYLNHQSFNNGSKVNSTPVLIACISDNHALNLSQAGVGQSMMISIDNGAIVCNDVPSYYHPVTVASGSIQYPLPVLDDGWHTLTLRVWDTDGNSAISTVNFIVEHSLLPAVYDIYASSAPDSQKALFYLVHDRPDAALRVTVAVYDIMGCTVWINTSVGRSDMFTSCPVEWDLTDMGGRHVPRGIYLYRAWVSEHGEVASGVGETATPTRKIAISGN